MSYHGKVRRRAGYHTNYGPPQQHMIVNINLYALSFLPCLRCLRLSCYVIQVQKKIEIQLGHKLWPVENIFNLAFFLWLCDSTEGNEGRLEDNS